MPRSFSAKISTAIGLACLGVSLSQSVSAQPAPQPGPTIAPAPETLPSAPPVSPRPVQPAPAPVSPVKEPGPAQQLLGQWKTKQPIGGDTLTLVFAPNGKAFLILSPATSQRTVGREIQYTIDAAPKPGHIDFILGDLGTVQTLFEINGKEMRLQLMETSPGKPRPTAFKEATVLEKVTDATTLPTGVELYNPQQGTRPPGQLEGRRYIRSMNRAQQAYYLENDKFSSDFQVLGLGVKSETENYRYQIVPQGDGKQQVMMTAVAKKADLKSYTGAVFVARNREGEALMLVETCETLQPSTTPPTMPKLVKVANQSDRVECPTGSQLVK